MAQSRSASQCFINLARRIQRAQTSDPLLQCLIPRLSRPYATHAELPPNPASDTATINPPQASPLPPTAPTASPFLNPVVATTYSWPEMRPNGLQQYAYHHLSLPLRRDILHRAVVYEADGARQGTASTKYRSEVKGSGKKVRPQKGSGRSRQSDFKSPSVRGGGVAHGPHPRDFATELPAKVYNLAFTTALSYRYKRGELILLKKSATLPEDKTARWLDNFFRTHSWGEGNGRTLVVLSTYLDVTLDRHQHLIDMLGQVGEHAELRMDNEVTVKDLLSCGRVLMERTALNNILQKTSDVHIPTKIEV